MGIAAAAQTPVTKLVLNDVGPFIPAAALKRIRDYMAMGAPPVFETAAQLVSFLRLVHAPFGDLTEAQWQQIGMPCARTLPDGTVTLHYDPRIAEPIAAAEPKDANLWPISGAITQPILAIRGVDSDLLLPDTLAQMAQMGAQTYVVEGAGHAPALMDDASIERIRQFLRG
jgi:pimeloyl-ACP methyl ester carboxylesterase